MMIFRWLSFVFLALVVGCSEQPTQQTQQVESLPKEILTRVGETYPALWFVNTDYHFGGAVGRVDLKTGEYEFDILPTGPDAQIFPDGERGLFLLNRRESDSIHVIDGVNAEVLYSRPLKERSNPQKAIRDSKNRVWLTSLDSNSVQVFSSDLTQVIKEIDLSPLKDDNDAFAELKGLMRLGEDRILVLAGRLKRSSKYWIPESNGGLAVIHSETFEIESQSLVDVPNPQRAFALPGSQYRIVGSGDLSRKTDLLGAMGLFHTNQLMRRTEMFSLILDSDIADQDTLVTIEWFPKADKSCIRYGTQDLYCETGDGGYIFNRIKVAGKVVFASYIKKGGGALWTIPLDGSAITKTPMPMPVESLSMGP